MQIIDAEPSVSPVIKKQEELVNFPLAITSVISGMKITKKEWDNRDTYGYLKDGFLMLHMDNTDHRWIVSEGDLVGEDWIILS